MKERNSEKQVVWIVVVGGICATLGFGIDHFLSLGVFSDWPRVTAVLGALSMVTTAAVKYIGSRPLKHEVMLKREMLERGVVVPSEKPVDPVV